MRIAIIGAGMAGAACGTALVAEGHRVTLFDKGRGAGGRMSTRRVSLDGREVGFDHGAQYFTARDPDFIAQVARWAEAGIVDRWPAAGEDVWVGVPGMNAPVAAMTRALDVRWSARVEGFDRQSDGWRLLGSDFEAGPFDAVLVAIPAEQAAPFLAPWDAGLAARAAAAPTDPCWTVMAMFPARLDLPDTLSEFGIVGWAARNSAKPGRAGPEAWVIQATPSWSRRHLEEPGSVVEEALLDALADRSTAPLPPAQGLWSHRWRYARANPAPAGPNWSPATGLGVCGDWLIGPRIECAWRSGIDLARAVGPAR